MEKIAPHLVEKPWAGPFLSKLFSSGDRPIGEAWLLSTLPEGESTIGAKTLSAQLGARLPFVVKVIAADKNLSIQVHPDDNWAMKLEGMKGKTECWLVIDAKPGAGVYLGLKVNVTHEQFRKALETNSAVDELMNFYPVQKGDFITVPAGTIHAIGGGVTLLEIQQASGITYRLWDWGRQGRELHLEKGLQVCSYSSRFELRYDLFNQKGNGLLFKHSDFECYLNQNPGEGWFIDLESFDVYLSDRSHSGQFVFVRRTL